MHEFAVTKLLFNEVKLYAEAKNAERVTDVYLAVGDLRGMLNEWVIKYFAYASKGSIIEGAKVHIQTIPGSVQCQNCGEVLPLTPEYMPTVCPNCGEEKMRMKSGTEFIITGIGIIEKGTGEPVCQK